MNSENTESVVGNAASSRSARVAATLESVDTGTVKLSSVPQAEIIKKYGRQEGDTGSPEVQIALITRRLEILSRHLKGNELDMHSQRGMMLLISQRKQLLQYLKNTDHARYKNLIGSLGLRK